jgi:hypothetical protein
MGNDLNMQTTIKLTQQDIKIIILDFYKRQGDIKESVHFYQTAVDKDDSEIYAIVSEKEKDLSVAEILGILWNSDKDHSSK